MPRFTPRTAVFAEQPLDELELLLGPCEQLQPRAQPGAFLFQSAANDLGLRTMWCVLRDKKHRCEPRRAIGPLHKCAAYCTQAGAQGRQLSVQGNVVLGRPGRVQPLGATSHRTNS